MFCGHEYAIQNLKFGLHVEPSNKDISSLLQSIETKRETKEPSVPSTIGENTLKIFISKLFYLFELQELRS